MSKVNISFGKVRLKIPSDRRYGGMKKDLHEIEITVVYVRSCDEIDNISWRLFTDRAITCFEAGSRYGGWSYCILGQPGD